MEKKLDQQTRKGMMPDIAGRRLGPRGSPYASPFGSPFVSRRVSSGVVGGASSESAGGSDASVGDQQQSLQNSLLLARVSGGLPSLSLSLSLLEYLLF